MEKIRINFDNFLEFSKIHLFIFYFNLAQLRLLLGKRWRFGTRVWSDAGQICIWHRRESVTTTKGQNPSRPQTSVSYERESTVCSFCQLCSQTLWDVIIQNAAITMRCRRPCPATTWSTATRWRRPTGFTTSQGSQIYRHFEKFLRFFYKAKRGSKFGIKAKRAQSCRAL